jgi:hypothetical protein
MLRLPTIARTGAKLIFRSASDASDLIARLFGFGLLSEACSVPVTVKRGSESCRRYSQADASSAR